MKISRVFTELLTALDQEAPPEIAIDRALRRLIRVSLAAAAGLALQPARSRPIVATAGTRPGSALDRWLRERLAEPARGARGTEQLASAPGWKGRGRPLVFHTRLGRASRPLGRLFLIGQHTSPAFQPDVIPATFPEEFGLALEQVCHLFDESRRRARHHEALLEAGRAVSRSLDLDETIGVILEQARDVLKVDSCGFWTLNETTGELHMVRSLDFQVPPGGVRLSLGVGLTGQAVKERRTLKTADLFADPRAGLPGLARQTGFRAMLVAPLEVGDRALGALTVLRNDVHEFTDDEEATVSALAAQAAMALEHARLYGSVREYSEQLEAMVAARTKELDEQKRFVEVVVETLPLGLYVVDRTLAVIGQNSATARGLGVPGRAHSSILDLVPPTTVPALEGLLARAFGSGHVQQAEEEITDPTGRRTFRLTAAPLPAPDGTAAAHAVLLAEDVTLEKRLQQQMLLTERLTTAGRLAAGVAHELNNPLATIAGCAEALRERARDPRLTHLDAFRDFPTYLSLVEEEAFRCKEITGSLLQFVREPGRRRVPTNLNALVEKVFELLHHQGRFAGSRMHADLDPELPAVIANEGQLRQVFLGISANGLEAMGGSGTLTVRTRRHGAEEVSVEFIDEGPGIPEELIGRVFEPFFTTKPPGQGTGLGLAIAQSIVVNEHGGRIDPPVSIPGQGTTFRVVLPVSPNERPA
jgi:two-component system NtrC family sensor kinase